MRTEIERSMILTTSHLVRAPAWRPGSPPSDALHDDWGTRAMTVAVLSLPPRELASGKLFRFLVLRQTHQHRQQQQQQQQQQEQEQQHWQHPVFLCGAVPGRPLLA
ncbi:uncharacterized protein THITE_2088916 [Thermothielavioides terrestris NRRL 8126]|uniref:Uncharacterized protein n=1 Tax=Thermothielavioides terrestris (strain ATCC 38088 / NRRL 8126) TaxID=578455 RepID=G2R8L4_THETT|nr:uncharacterized protein THITE_2088916 [Thermothielavioides terrestris NRRL 8126]AEO67429.1 hypothetical protein THITE_2088916 [Thermothielavioides terrestris NRRL 8126]